MKQKQILTAKQGVVSAMQQKSKFTLLVYYRNGYASGMKYHSWKQERRKWNGFEITDQRYAFNRLTHIIDDLHKGKYKTAILYDNESGREIIRWAYGMMKSCESFQWEYEQDGSVKFQFVQHTGAVSVKARMLKEDARYSY